MAVRLRSLLKKLNSGRSEKLENCWPSWRGAPVLGVAEKTIPAPGSPFLQYRHALEEAEIGKNIASRWQQVAAIPAFEFDNYLAERQAKGEQATTAGLLKEAKEEARQQQKATLIEQIRVEPTSLPTGPFRVIVIDPPWPYDCRLEDATHRGRLSYPEMSVPQVKALPVARCAHQERPRPRGRSGRKT